MTIPQDEIDLIKERCDLVDVVLSRDISLRKKGINYVGLCPFHKEKSPSFTINTRDKLWQCFGCGKGGDVIRFVELFDKVSFPAAVKTLKKGFSLTAPAIKEKGPDKNKPPAPPTSRQQRLLNRVSQYYQGAFSSHNQGMEYLKERGIDDKQAMIDFCVGYAAGTLLEAIPPDGDVVDDLKTIRVLNDKGKEFFYGCVVFPMQDDNGNVVGMYGRRIEEGGADHLYLIGPRRGLINRQAAKRSQSLILTESIIDALSLYAAGFKNVIPCYGTNGLIEDHLTLFSRCGVNEVYICFDSDDPGITGAERIAGQLKEKNITSYMVRLPEKDVNDYFKRYTPEEFESIIKEANPESLERSEKVEKRREGEYRETDHGFMVCYGLRCYEIKGIARQGTQLKATIKVSLKEGDGRFELSTIDLYSSRSREWFARLCTGLLGEKEPLIKEDLNRLLERVERYRPIDRETRKEKTLTEGEKAEALSLLKDPHLFEEILAKHI